MTAPPTTPDDLDTWRALPDRPAAGLAGPGAGRAATAELAKQPPLVFAGECDQLKERLAAVARGEVFVLQGGDCAETFAGSTADAVRDKLKTLLQMAVVLTYAASVPVVKVGRMAGQFAKPRSRPTESRDGAELPAYRGEAVNGFDFTPEARRPDPARLLRAYHCAGGHAEPLPRVHERRLRRPARGAPWNQDFVAESPAGQRYERLAGEIDRALSFMKACGADPEELHGVEFYSSHEGLLLEYERALTSIDSRTGLPYDLSAHLLWIGERTRDLSGAHVEFFSHVRNPIGVKLGPTTSPDDAVGLIERLNPEHEPGRLTFITRLGAERVRDVLPPLVEEVTRLGAPVGWVCDPMHGNTFEAPSGHKTRRFDHVLDEVAGFFEVHRALGTHPGGIHVEFTGDDVTECMRRRGDRGRPAPPLRDGLRPPAQPPPVARPGVHRRRDVSAPALSSAEPSGGEAYSGGPPARASSRSE